MKVQVMAKDKTVADLNRLMGSQNSPLHKWISKVDNNIISKQLEKTTAKIYFHTKITTRYTK
jgi:hypothetical protein